MLILTGPPGVGKTTVAALLAEREERAVQVEADRFFYFIRSGRIAPWEPQSDAQNQVAVGAAADAAARYARAGYETILDGIVIPRWTLGTVREVVSAAGLEADYAVLRAPRSECLARFEQREGGPELLDPEIVAAIGAEFDDLGELERCAVDVAGIGPEQAANAVVQARAEGSLRLVG